MSGDLRVPVAVTPSGDRIELVSRSLAIVGATGSGKTTVAQTVVASFVAEARRAGVELGIVILDPKHGITWGSAKPRCSVITDPSQWVAALIGLNDEIEARYSARDLARPMVMLLIEETPSILGSSSMLIKRDADKARELALRIARTGRECGVFIALVSQSFLVESVPSGIRAAVPQRLVLATYSEEEASAATMSRTDEIGMVSSLLPGEAYVLGYGDQRFRRGRCLRCPDFADRMAADAARKPRLAFLENRGIEC